MPIGHANRGERPLELIAGRYDQRPIERTTVRILDALLWSTHPASVLYSLLARWRTTLAVQPLA